MKNIILVIALFLINTAYSQTYQDTICWVWVNDAQYDAIPGEDLSSRSDLNS